MTQTLKLVQNQILQNQLSLQASQQTIQMEIDLPDILGQAFRYTLQLSSTPDGLVQLQGFTRNLEIADVLTFSLGTKYTITASGEFLSASSVLTLFTQRSSNNITLTIS